MKKIYFIGCLLVVFLLYYFYQSNVFIIPTFSNKTPIIIDGIVSQRIGDNIYPQTMNILYPVKISIQDKQREVFVKKISHVDNFPIFILSKSGVCKLILHTLPYKSSFPQTKLTVKNFSNLPQEKGYILTSFHGVKGESQSYATIFDTEGNLIWYRGNPHLEYSTFHLQQHRIKDKLRYSMHIQSDNVSLSWIRGKHLLMNERFEVIDEIQAVATPLHPIIPADEHEFVYIDDGHYIVLAYEEKNAPVPGYNEPQKYINVYIQEQKNGKVIFEWSSDHYPDFFNACIEKCIGAKDPDYMHINSIFIDPNDNNLIVSAASNYSVFKIDRKTGDIIWRLGGKNDDFNLDSNLKFTRQHDAHLTHDNHLIVFDNGFHSTNGSFLNRTRILKFKLDEENKKILSSDVIFPFSSNSMYMGNAQILDNGDIFIGCGSTSECSAKLLDKNKKEKFTLSVNKPYFNYRAYFVKEIVK